MSISVIVAALNAGSTIEEQLAALATQDDPSIEYEVLVCDNGSQDETRELVLRRAWADSRFKLIDASASPGPARNIGVSHARGSSSRSVTLTMSQIGAGCQPWPLRCRLAM